MPAENHIYEMSFHVNEESLFCMLNVSSKHADHHEEEEDGNHHLISTYYVPGTELSAEPGYLVYPSGHLMISPTYQW